MPFHTLFRASALRLGTDRLDCLPSLADLLQVQAQLETVSAEPNGLEGSGLLFQHELVGSTPANT
jgi:hypothetical protein